MTLAASGTMSLGGSDATRSVACELGLSGTSQICFNQAAVRTLAGVPSGQISMSNFYSKTAAPGGLGCFYGGGYYTGAVASPANYYLIVAPQADGYGCCFWKPSMGTTGSTSCTDGYFNTYTYLNNATHPAGQFTATRTINGFSDWYLPARNELNLMYQNGSSMPAGQGYLDDEYWSSTEVNSNNACRQIFPTDGRQGEARKDECLSTRAVRRVAF